VKCGLNILAVSISAHDPKRKSRLGTKGLYIKLGSPWENGYCESFNGKLRDECLNGEIPKPPMSALARFGKVAYASAVET